MAELYPAPFANLIDRVFREFSGEGKIFDLPRRSFYRADPKLSTDVSFLGRRAATPVGPAAGPQSQLAQNIVLAWLAGARIIELKTIQINDRLEIPRPCIDVRTIGFNVEWSQELRLEDSLREYVAAWMLIRMIREAGILDREESHGETIFDLSVGYDLEGIRHPRVSGFIRQLQDATTIIEELRAQIPDAYGRFRDIDYDPHVIGSATLSTFHGCPAGEIEQIVDFLMTTFHLDVVIKMNPTLLGYERVERLLHEMLGYTEIELDPSAFEHDLQFDEALEITKRLARRAESLGVRLGVKFSNTLVVKNHDTYFSEDVMYMSGPPLHVITLNLVDRFRKAEGGSLPISFSAGVDQKNFP
ncbi:MAG: glutamate synthase, partial [Deltaproteobacteria bacterium]